MQKIIIVVPCYNEAESLPHLIKSLNSIKSQTKNYQMDFLLINDGSTDDTQKAIRQFSETYPHIYFRTFANNAGHQSALRAGLSASVGYDAVIMMDADMQHPPTLIPKMIKKWEGGNKIVQMIRRDSSQEAGFIKYLTSKGYYWLINHISDLKLDYGASDFRLIDRSVVNTVANSHETDLFLRGYFSWLKVSRANIIYKPDKRVAGNSKYNFRKMLDLAAKGVLQFSEKPLQIAMLMGIALAFASFLYGIVLVVRYFVGGHTVSGWTSLMVIILFCFSISFILMGIIGTYLAHSISIQKQRPEYIVVDEKLPQDK